MGNPANLFLPGFAIPIFVSKETCLLVGGGFDTLGLGFVCGDKGIVTAIVWIQKKGLEVSIGQLASIYLK